MEHVVVEKHVLPVLLIVELAEVAVAAVATMSAVHRSVSLCLATEPTNVVATPTVTLPVLQALIAEPTDIQDLSSVKTTMFIKTISHTPATAQVQ